jgi:predicted amino acid dehydrogenase
MSADYPNLLFLAVGSIGTLLGALLLDRWWRERTYDLNGKTVLITGGSRGLGLVMARQFIQEGARLAICARDTTELERARNELGTIQVGPMEVMTLDDYDEAMKIHFWAPLYTTRRCIIEV